MEMDPDLHDRWLARVQSQLTACGYNHGAAREAVIAVLACKAQCLIEPQEIIDELRLSGRGSPATVYRALGELNALELIRRVDGVDGTARYEITEPDHHHHHYLDESSGQFHAFNDRELELALELTAKRLGIEITRCELIIHGIGNEQRPKDRGANRHPRRPGHTAVAAEPS